MSCPVSNCFVVFELLYNRDNRARGRLHPDDLKIFRWKGHNIVYLLHLLLYLNCWLHCHKPEVISSGVFPSPNYGNKVISRTIRVLRTRCARSIIDTNNHRLSCFKFRYNIVNSSFCLRGIYTLLGINRLLSTEIYPLGYRNIASIFQE